MPSESGVLDLHNTEPLQHCADHPEVSEEGQIHARISCSVSERLAHPDRFALSSIQSAL